MFLWRQVVSMSMPSPDDLVKGDPVTELSSNRTSLSFERTLGVLSHIRSSQQLTERRDRLFMMGPAHRDIHYRATPTLMISAALPLLAIATLVSIFFRLTL